MRGSFEDLHHKRFVLADAGADGAAAPMLSEMPWSATRG